eukprot:1851588-Amphidinium_carterae.1
MVAALATYARVGVPTSNFEAERRDQGTPVVKALGNLVDGNRAMICCPTEPLMLTWLLVREVVNRNRATKHELQIILGRLVRVLLHRQPLMCCLDAAWRWLSRVRGSAKFLVEVKFELIRYASLIGGAYCLGTGLSRSGKLMAASFRGCKQTNTSSLALVEWGARLGSCRIVLQRFKLRVTGHLVYVPSAPAQRCIKFRWPDAVFLKDFEVATVLTQLLDMRVDMLVFVACRVELQCFDAKFKELCAILPLSYRLV